MGYKTFVAGEEALAADVNAYLMGQTVARFPSAAARTTQLPAPATGQLSSLDTRPSVVQYWNGSAWVDADVFVQMGFLSGTTNGAGDITLTYPTAFAAGTFVPVFQNATPGGVSLMFSAITSTASTVTIRCFIGTTGAAYASASVGILWVAFGYRP